MELVILTGLQGAGKSTFVRERFYATHVRINLDMLRTRHRERRLVEVCVETGTRFVVDNTNPTRADRAVYIAAARASKAFTFRVVGYDFRSTFADCVKRNDGRPSPQRVPHAGLRGTAGRLEVPNPDEGFDALYVVRTVPPGTGDEGGGFVVEEWADDVRRS